MFAPFYDLTLMHHTDLIRITDRRETVGDHYGRTILHQVLQRFLYQTFGFRIQGGCGLIQDQDRGILQDRTGDTDSLALSAGQFSTPVADIGIVTFLTRYDKIVSVGDAAASSTCSIVAPSTPKAILLKKVSLNKIAS